MSAVTILLFSILLNGPVHASGDHKEGHEHGEHADHEEAGHGEEEAPKNVGPEKGVTAYDEKKGFVLSPEATRNFRIETKQLEGQGPWTVDAKALLSTREEKSVYRVREGFLKRIDVEIRNKKKETVSISSHNLRSGDAVVVRGSGFIRIAEVDLTSGETEHHH